MTDKPKKLSDTARALLTAAAMRNDNLVPLPRLPVAAVRQVVRSLMNAGFAGRCRRQSTSPVTPGAPVRMAEAWRCGRRRLELPAP